MIEQLELPDLEDPLAYLHGSYRSVGDLPITVEVLAPFACSGAFDELAEAVGRAVGRGPALSSQRSSSYEPQHTLCGEMPQADYGGCFA